jgi:hypothetical protein
VDKARNFETTKEIAGNTLEHIGLDNDFLNGTPRAQQ